MRDVPVLLTHHRDPGEIGDAVAQMPAELKDLWPETARAEHAGSRGP